MEYSFLDLPPFRPSFTLLRNKQSFWNIKSPEKWKKKKNSIKNFTHVFYTTSKTIHTKRTQGNNHICSSHFHVKTNLIQFLSVLKWTFLIRVVFFLVWSVSKWTHYFDKVILMKYFKRNKKWNVKWKQEYKLIHDKTLKYEEFESY